MINFSKIKFVGMIAFVSLVLSSCSGTRSLIIPRAVSSADAISLKDLNLERNNYEVLSTVSQSATIRCKIKRTSIEISGIDDDFYYKFKYNRAMGWYLDSFHGIATLGYFVNDSDNQMSKVPNPEEFSRRTAASHLISAIKDYDADGIIEPITTTTVTQEGRNVVVFTTKISAKLVRIKTN